MGDKHSSKRANEDEGVENDCKKSKLTVNKIKYEQVSEDLKELKLAFNTPKIYVTNYFDDLRNEIDIETTRFLQTLNNNLKDEKSVKALNDQGLFIEKIKTF